MVTTAVSTVETIQAKFPQAVLDALEFRGEQTLLLNPESLVSVCSYLKKTLQYEMLETITAVDWQERMPRYDVVYQLLSIQNQCFVRLKVQVGKRREKHPAVPTVTGVWPGANWYEREIFDLFGLTFTDHPDLRRLLMPPDWTTHPLRKDYPLTGLNCQSRTGADRFPTMSIPARAVRPYAHQTVVS